MIITLDSKDMTALAAKVDDHERMEDFVIGGGRPFAPVHKPGADPYIVVQVASREDVDTDFRGRRVHPD